MDSLINKAVSGLRWTILLRFTAQLFGWAVTIIIIRFLNPDDYGLHAISEMLYSFLIVLASGGIGSALIQTKDLSEKQQKQVFSFLLFICFILFFVQISSAPYIAAYYNDSRLTDIIRVLAIGILIMPFSSMYEALLIRSMAFKKVAFIELKAHFIGSIVLLSLAIYGAGVWSLIIAQLLIMILKTIGCMLSVGKIVLPTINMTGVSKLLFFGGYVSATTFIWFVCQRLDVGIGGRVIGINEIGVYVIAMHIATLPMVKLVPLINQVAFPTYSRMQNNLEEVKYYFLKSIRTAGFLMTPIFFGIAAIASDLVPLLLGEKWISVSDPLMVLCLSCVLRTISNIYTPVVVALGSPQVEFGNTIIFFVIMAPSIYIGTNWGIMGLSYAWLIAYVMVFIICSMRSSKAADIPFLKFLSQLVPSLIASTIMFAIIKSSSLLFFINDSWFDIFAEILLGVFIYALIIIIIDRQSIYTVLKLVKP